MRSKSRQLSLDKTGSLFGSRSGTLVIRVEYSRAAQYHFLKLRSAVSVEGSADNEGLPAFIEIRGRFLV
jgi:hypothetical protein